MKANQINTSYTYTKAVFCRSSLPTVVNGLSALEKITYWMHGGLHTVLEFSRWAAIIAVNDEWQYKEWLYTSCSECKTCMVCLMCKQGHIPRVTYVETWLHCNKQGLHIISYFFITATTGSCMLNKYGQTTPCLHVQYYHLIYWLDTVMWTGRYYMFTCYTSLSPITTTSL